jgi:HAD superfamily hydrolase (TIGR01509 family)
MIKAVLFDLDDTLFDHRGCARKALAAVQGCHDRFRSMPFDALERAHARFLEELHLDVMRGRMPLETARIERFRRLLEAASVPSGDGLAARIAAIYRDTYRTARRAVAGAPALLAAVKSHAAIAIVSNNLLEEQQEKLRTCGLDSFVDALVVSEEAGSSKPDPAIFRLALDRLHALPGDAVMVGDSWAADVVGARAAGIRAIWFNPAGALAPADEIAVPELRALEPVDAAMRMILDDSRFAIRD